MTAFAALKFIHVCAAVLSIAGFTVRCAWRLTENPLSQHRLTKTIPHVVDTALLSSAIGMLWVLQLSPLESPWLLAKLLALLVYIGFGVVALRLGNTPVRRATAALLALATAAYIISVALTKSAWGWLPT